MAEGERLGMCVSDSQRERHRFTLPSSSGREEEELCNPDTDMAEESREQQRSTVQESSAVGLSWLSSSLARRGFGRARVRWLTACKYLSNCPLSCVPPSWESWRRRLTFDFLI